MIYITGDVHIPTEDIQKLGSKRFPEQKHLNENDYVIICGDFGGVWNGSREEKYWVKWLNNKNFTTLFIDGNHENFDMLNKYDEVLFHSGRAHKISDKIYHLMRGEVFEFDGKRIFTLGGASSHDKEYRKEGETWWSDEIPSSAELKAAREKLVLYENRVDMIITHCAPSSLQKLVAPRYDTNILTEFLEDLKTQISYKKWYFGHYHIDKEIDERHIAIFNEIVKVS